MRLLVLGGDGNNFQWETELLDFNPDPNTACYFPPNAPTSILGSVGAYIKGRPVISGGSGNDQCFEYSFESQEWQQIPGMG